MTDDPKREGEAGDVPKEGEDPMAMDVEQKVRRRGEERAVGWRAARALPLQPLFTRGADGASLGPQAVPEIAPEDEEEEEVEVDEDAADMDAADEFASSDEDAAADAEVAEDGERRAMKLKLQREERERIRKQKLRQKEELEKYRRDANVEVAMAEAKSAKDRMAFLVKQTELFAHFMTRSPGGDNGKGKGKGKGKGDEGGSRRGKALFTEAEEDKMMMSEALDSEHDAGVALTVQPKSIVNGKLFPYQIAGLNWLVRLYDRGLNGILADEMGLGKTLQSISLLGYLADFRGVRGPHIIIVPKSTLSNWMNELRKWCPSLRAFKFHGSKDERVEMRAAKLSRPGLFDVMVTSYEMCIAEAPALRRFHWRYAIVDEAHRLKNENSKLSATLRTFRTSHRLLLTGTPLQNNLHELWALLNFLLPDIFSSSEAFDEWFGGSGATQGDETVKQLHKILRPFLLRRLKTDVVKDLPRKRELKLFVGMSEMQKHFYTKMLLRDFEALNSTGKDGDKVRLLNIVMQLRKTCNHPYLFDGAEPGPPYENGPHMVENSGKMVVLDKLLPRLKEKGSRVLIFSQMTRMLDILEDYMFDKQYQYCRIDGSTDSDVRKESIDAFNKPDSEKFVFLLSTRAGGLGINLATADTVIIFDSDWNPQMDLQAQDRAHRIGQKKPVNVFRLVTQDSIEVKIVERAERKLLLDAVVIQQGRLQEQNKGLSKNEMLSMIRFGADAIFENKSGTVTDEDIDAILGRAVDVTAEMEEKIKDNANNTLLTFDYEAEEESLYTFGGKDFSNKAKQGAKLNWIAPPKRNKGKKTYNTDEYYRALMRANGDAKGPAAPRMPRMASRKPFQFFNEAVLGPISDKQRAYFEANKITRAETEPNPETGLTNGLTPEEIATRDEEMARGFGNWNHRDYRQFIKGCEKHGRTKLEDIANEIDSKSYDDVVAYSKAFWEHIDDLPDTVKRQIEAGEERIERRAQMESTLNREMSKYDDPRKIKINYGVGGVQGKSYSVDEDRFLIYNTYLHGLGNLDKLKAEVRRAPVFRFNWFIKSRSPQELGRRVDVLIRALEKESSKKRKSAGGDDGKTVKKAAAAAE